MAMADARSPGADDQELNTKTLKAQLKAANRRRTWRAVGLVAPLFLFVAIFFISPIAGLLGQAVHSPEFVETFPRSAKLLKTADSLEALDEGFYKPFFEELQAAQKARTLGSVARRLNQDRSGMLGLFKKTGRKAKRLKAMPDNYRDWFASIDKRWLSPETLGTMRNAATTYTDFYMLTALDMKRNAAGDVEAVEEGQALFIDVMLRTMEISFGVTIFCILLGYPLAWVIAHAGTKVRNVLLIGVLFPFWTSLLVRTAAWIIVLQKEGPINKMLINLNLINEPLQLVFNRFGVYVALTHILLPFLVLPLYSVMKSIPRDYMRAAKSLGAKPIPAFFLVYFPQTLPGLGAGAILVFILSVGYYITPALVGGPKDQMISYFIAFYTNNTINWGLASALAFNLLVVTLVLYALYQRITGGGKVGMGA